MEFRNALPPASDARIARVQSHHRVRFPPEYVSLLKRHNGAEVEEGVFQSGGKTFVVDRLLPILDDHRATNDGAWDVAVVITYLGSSLSEDPDQIGSRLIPFALLRGDDYLCLDFRRSSDSPSVVVFDSEQSAEWHPAVTEVAPTFSDFIRKF